MGEPVWVDQTLNTAICWQFAGSRLDELAKLLAELGITEADICLEDWRWYRPNLAAVQNYLVLRGIVGKDGVGIKLARQANVTEVVVPISIDGFAIKLETIMNQARQVGVQVTLLINVNDLLGPADVETIVLAINEFDVTRVVFADGSGLGDPFAIYNQLEDWQRALNCPVELRASNAYGMATANALAAMRAGVLRLATAVAGVGGYTPWEEALLAARQLGGQNLKLPQNLAQRCQQVLHMLGLNLPENKAVIGPDIFAHESGLHVDGVTKAPEIYEPYDPELVGLTRQLVIGKHSGRAALKTKFAAWGICLEEAETRRLLKGVRALAVRKKTAITDEELQWLYRSV